ncbi:DUF6265 family protein [Nonlabens ponticola]|uniref:DUF6265 domain-containing protein n=1 Tax=Nonlabens ponticola TaxID=2496866 RepID=A0A3S9MVH8_9FLAO|nr:DUF6265 family protein [Nonlabens ponticola]AZQ43152.1 hypothetical protein EJ995_02475 [Nonlabens ponticola]
MRKLSVILLVLCCACSNNDPESLDWILGSWQRTDDPAGRQSYEEWTKTDDGYQGFAYAMRDGDTIFREEMKITKTDKWTLFVEGTNHSTATLTSLEFKQDSISVFNPALDFPTQIHYWIAGDTLKAQVVNDVETIDFNFVKR